MVRLMNSSEDEDCLIDVEELVEGYENTLLSLARK
jgi:hypothetical protein